MRIVFGGATYVMRYFFGFVAALGSCALPAVLQAHHSRANFLLDKIVELHGTVTEVSFVNPHAWVTLSVVNERGVAEPWTLELNSLPMLHQRGWREDSVRVGERITVRANPDRDPQRHFLFTIAVVKANGTELRSSGIPNNPASNGSPSEGRAGSKDFTADPWGNGRGLPSSDSKEVVERYTLLDSGSALQVEYTQTDPMYLARPVKRKGILSLDSKTQWQNAVCDRAAARRHLSE